jgi:hypothetical protein
VYEFNTEQVFAAFNKAPNINAAIKNYLKRWATNQGPEAARFAKDLREVMTGRAPEAAKALIDKNLSKRRDTLLAIGACAHAELIDQVTAAIIEQYADDFNATYSAAGESITVNKERDFEAIVEKALAQIEKLLAAQELPDSKFLKAIAVSAIFEPAVLKEMDRRRLVV